MKNKLAISVCALAIIVTLLYSTFKNGIDTIPPSPSTAGRVSQADRPEEEAFVTDSIRKALEEAKLPPDYPVTAEQREKILSKARAKAMVPTDEELKVMFETPVEFYGRVLDQFDQPIIGAKIRCSWPFMGPKDSALEMKSSAPDGQFEILGLKALSIHISVYPPPGYDEQVRDAKNIQIAKAPDRLLKKMDFKNATPEQLENVPPTFGGPEAYKGDRKQPVIFRLKKL